MKKRYYLYLFFLLSFASCAGNGSKKVQSAETDSIIESKCYLAIDGKDSAFLNVKTLKSGKISGDLLITFENMPKNEGEIEGTTKGDTLFVDYSFKVGQSNVIKKNPLAFLKKDRALILGVGVIETAFGKSYFVKKKPINFERGRFKFELKTCENSN